MKDEELLAKQDDLPIKENEESAQFDLKEELKRQKKLALKNKFKITKRSPGQIIWRCVLIFVICFGVAASYYCFITPNNFAPGGIYGIGSMVESKSGGAIPMGAIVIALSIPLLIASFIVLDFESALLIAVLAITTNVMEILMAHYGFFQYKAADGDKVTKIFAAILGGGLSGATFAYTIKIFGTADGTIALAAIVKKKRPDVSIAWATFALDAIVVISSLFVFWKEYTLPVSDKAFSAKVVAAMEPIMYSLINMFMVSKICDIILKGFVTAYKFEIITEKPDDISREIIEKLGRGVTVVPAKGMYTKQEKFLLICIVRKRQIGEFQRIIKSYPDTFGYISSSSEVMGHFTR